MESTPAAGAPHWLATLGCALPVIQAPMAGVQGVRLAAAVCAAGGLGSLPGAMISPHQLREQVAALVAAAPGAPFNLNFFAHAEPPPEPAREAAWRAALAPYYAAFGLDPAAVAPAPARRPFADEMAEVVAACRPAVVSFHFGLPEARLLQKVRDAGARILASATTVNEARWLAARGVDAIIAQGIEAGGHRGHFLDDDLGRQMGLSALLPRVVEAVACPVIAAGGMVDAVAVRAARALGAAAVQAGTLYLCCPEADTGPLQRAELARAADPANGLETTLTTLFSGRPARGLVNRLMRELGPRSTLAPAFPLAGGALAPLRAAAEAQGLTDFTPLWCGQRPHCPPRPAAELTRALAEGW